jgi:hypothetical protein
MEKWDEVGYYEARHTKEYFVDTLFLNSKTKYKILYAFLILSIFAARHTQITPTDLITLIMFSEEYKLWNSPLCNSLQPPVTSPS